MATMWCPECRAEYVEGVTVCADCGVSLVAEAPSQDPAGGPGEAGDDDSEVLVYELAEWSADERGVLDTRLQVEGIEHRWEGGDGEEVRDDIQPGHPWEVGTDLVVGAADEAAVDAIIDEVEFPDELPATQDDGAVDEAIYSVMSGLYVAADRLKDDPGDLAVAGEFFDAADAARATEPPFGIDAQVWSRVQELAAAVTTALETEADDDVIAERSQSLRDLLFDYV